MMFILSFAILLLILLAVLCAFTYKLSTHLKRFTPSETQLFNEDIVILRDGITNVFLIKGSDGYIAIDAGRNSNKLKSALKAVKIQAEDICAVFLTHSDPDHVNGLGLFEKAVIYLPKKEEELVTGTRSRAFGIFKNHIKKPYIAIDDDEKIEVLGRQIISKAFPGHTPGSTAYIVNDKYLFTGDILELQGKSVASFPTFFNMDDALNRVNYLKVKKILNYDYMFTGHSGHIKKEDIVWE